MASLGDRLENLLEGEHAAFLERLLLLPHAYDGPDGVQPGPYGLLAFGEASAVAPVLRSWYDEAVVSEGTQFLLCGGFDEGAVARYRSDGLGAARIITVGFSCSDPDLFVPSDPLGFFTYASFLGFATGHAEAVLEARRCMAALAEILGPRVATEANPAKQVAWSLWNRVPLLLAPRRFGPLPGLLQRGFARVGKALALAVGDHPLEWVATAFEARHRDGDDVVALQFGPDDAEQALVREVLSTRIAQIERLELPPEEVPETPEAAMMAYWYYGIWVASYLALLHEQDPAESEVYRSAVKAGPV